MEPKVPATFLYPEPDQASPGFPTTPSYFLEIHYLLLSVPTKEGLADTNYGSPVIRKGVRDPIMLYVFCFSQYCQYLSIDGTN